MRLIVISSTLFLLSVDHSLEIGSTDEKQNGEFNINLHLAKRETITLKYAMIMIMIEGYCANSKEKHMRLIDLKFNQ
jgi:hypothetical protein